MRLFIYNEDRKEVDRFCNKIHFADNNCWEWSGCINKDGYAIFKAKNVKTRLAHRISYWWTHNDLVQGMVIDHLCQNKKCVNPDHLEQVNFVENVLRADGWGGTNYRKVLCPKGHRLLGDNLVENQLQYGSRECKTCHNALTRKRRNDHDPDWESSSLQTHCKEGHELTEDNLVGAYIKNKERKCKTCHNARVADYMERAKTGGPVKRVKNHNTKKTHCKRGHRLTEDNLDKCHLKRGIRKCKKCHNLRVAKSYRKKNPEVKRRAKKTA